MHTDANSPPLASLVGGRFGGLDSSDRIRRDELACNRPNNACNRPNNNTVLVTHEKPKASAIGYHRRIDSCGGSTEEASHV